MFNKIVALLKEQGLTIATMESCTGGCLSSLITNESGSSEVTQGGYVTYSVEQKVRCGVPKRVIDSKGVYSSAVATEMARACKEKTGSNIGVGITGQFDEVNEVYICIMDEDNIITKKLKNIEGINRHEKKLWVCERIASELEYLLC